ncbi:hypothetical protein Rsub_03234 [Raphidocelis subcapitata]|uniref:Carbohydrate-binding domain-containing protein n=1 Tax=Raphidocelis subcapitata TaxID=307507 RepID=A0A2V0NVF9_9CHLO|nr:hypothetical protein Rsub_03234 [Raphidocelis subcapitata]|eukprot:GBF90662.1 hypothetical protein Rsub_03234 [Raphidocelis subcapitata]
MGPHALTLLLVALAVPLPYVLRDKPHPRGYVARRVTTPPAIDGDLSEPSWAAAPWSDAFADIVGPTGPKPWGSARVKMLWDGDALYVAARMEDPRLFAFEELHDSVVYRDTDFEVFIDPDGDNFNYLEVEVNGLGAVWDLLLTKPYRNGGLAVMNYETVPPATPTARDGPTGWSPMRHAVKVEGAVNSKAGTKAWQVEMALPWSTLRHIAGRRTPPRSGDAWRINFSNVMWTVKWDAKAGRYAKDPPNQEPYNFVWSPQYQVAMHQPETWGYVQFEADDVLSGSPPPPFAPDPTWPARAFLMELADAQHRRWREAGAFATSLAALGLQPPPNATAVADVRIQATEVSFVASAAVPAPGGAPRDACTAARAVGGGWAAGDRPARLYITSEGRLTLAFPGGDGALAYAPAEGNSRWC